MNIAAGVFKAQCLKLMDEVQNSREEIIITKFGKPVAKLVPIGKKELKRPLYGFLKGVLSVQGNIVKSTGEKWLADE